MKNKLSIVLLGWICILNQNNLICEAWNDEVINLLNTIHNDYLVNTNNGNHVNHLQIMEEIIEGNNDEINILQETLAKMNNEIADVENSSLIIQEVVDIKSVPVDETARLLIDSIYEPMRECIPTFELHTSTELSHDMENLLNFDVLLNTIRNHIEIILSVVNELMPNENASLNNLLCIFILNLIYREYRKNNLKPDNSDIRKEAEIRINTLFAMKKSPNLYEKIMQMIKEGLMGVKNKVQTAAILGALGWFFYTRFQTLYSKYEKWKTNWNIWFSEIMYGDTNKELEKLINEVKIAEDELNKLKKKLIDKNLFDMKQKANAGYIWITMRSRNVYNNFMNRNVNNQQNVLNQTSNTSRNWFPQNLLFINVQQNCRYLGSWAKYVRKFFKK